MTDRAVKAAATRKTNEDTEVTWARNVEGNLLLSDKDVKLSTDAQLGLYLRAWNRVVPVTFSNGCHWPGAWPGGFPTGSGSKSSLKKAEKQAAVLAVIGNYREMQARALE